MLLRKATQSTPLEYPERTPVIITFPGVGEDAGMKGMMISKNFGKVSINFCLGGVR